ncbi:MAG TPA: biotin carboxylase N-terminal domain-containing protein [Steroidobacteraceae bacterium]|nr:biotin carboxylase N-terminal domain-containing protein [Steroidobacteraceae bacterium]
MILRRLLIANRGEIAVRILRTAQSLGIECVLAASEADLASVPARLADRTVCIGPGPSHASYLNGAALIAAALANHVQAVHPGYGFLSENASFARQCREAGLTFIGPTEEQLGAVGDKLKARAHALAAGLPVVPGGAVSSAADALALAERIGWPVLIKAVGGGGGRGMKPVHEPAQMAHAAELAMAEAAGAFGDPRIYLERFVAAGRHVEVQLLGDGAHVVHLGERDCSVQRRYQKLIEEAPAPALPDELRRAMYAAAVAFGTHLRYRGAGTVEFLVDTVRREFYFLEMNARIQVEHPVTEALTGLDMVAEQIAIAEGRPLRVAQSAVVMSGHALECRVNAEDVSRDFRPSPGTVRAAVFPAGRDVRVDTHIEAGTTVPPFYDSLLAKVIVHGPDRASALARMRAALASCRIEGVESNLALHRALLQEPQFVQGGVDTSYLTRQLPLR